MPLPATVRFLLPMVLGLLASGLCQPLWAEDVLEHPQLRLNVPWHTAPITAIGFTADGNLCTAGLDKVLHVWRLPRPGRPLRSADEVGSRIRRLQTIRWEVGAGLRGSIYAAVLHPTRAEVAFGGFGYRGGTGEIILADLRNGRHLDANHQAHRQSIASLAYSADGRWFASADISGRVLLWDVADDEHSAVHGAGVEVSRADGERVQFRPICFLGNGRLVTPEFHGTQQGGTVRRWRLRSLVANDRRKRELLPEIHYGQVTTLAGSADGRWLFSADSARRLYRQQVLNGTGTRQPVLSTPAAVTSLAASSDGRYVLIGTDRSSRQDSNSAYLQLRDAATGRVIRERQLPAAVRSVAISNDDRWIAYNDGARRVVVEPLLGGGEVVLPGGHSVTEARFLLDDDSPYAVSCVSNAGGEATRFTFRPADLDRDPFRGEESRLVVAAGTADRRVRVNAARNSMQVVTANGAELTITLETAADGAYERHSWLRSGEGLAIATSVQNRILLYDLSSGSLSRVFVGHHGRILSLDCAPDDRYLVSGSSDGTIRYWSLQGWRDGVRERRRWGAAFAVEDEQLIVTELSDRSPLDRLGLAVGDAIVRTRWPSGSGAAVAELPREILWSLTELPASTQVVFETARDGRARPPFQTIAAWAESLAAYATEREWIAWTPAGYYACSAAGERLIGWQINGSLGSEPAFYPAVRFSKSYYRPRLMRQLLEAGGLRAASRAEAMNRRLADIRPPAIRILKPAEGEVVVDRPFVELTAEAISRNDLGIQSLQLFLDGRPAQHHLKGIQREVLRHRETWRVPLTPGVHRISVRADNEFSHDLSYPLTVVYDPDRARPKLYLLAVGVSAYPSRLALNYAHQDASDLGELLSDQSVGIYDIPRPRLLLDDAATKEAIQSGLDWIRDNLALGDLAVVFFSGHGMRQVTGEPATESLFLLPVDANLERIAESSISEEMLKTFCRDVGGRGNLLILVDACHAGALRLDMLARELATDDYRVVMMASSKGDETSIEVPELGNGVFTRALLEALRGSADLFMGGNGLVESDEVGGYVVRRARSLALQYSHQQTPLYNQPGVEPIPITRAR